MKQPAKFYFEHQNSHTLFMSTDHKTEVVKSAVVKSLIEASPECDYMKISTTGGYYGPSKVTLDFYSKKEHSPEAYANLLAEQNLTRKLDVNQKTLGVLRQLEQQLKGENRATDELVVAQKKLNDLIANCRIPLPKKQEFLKKAEEKIKLLELKVNCEAPGLLAQVQEQMKILEGIIQAQSGIMDIQTDYKEPSPYDSDDSDDENICNVCGYDCDDCDD